MSKDKKEDSSSNLHNEDLKDVNFGSSGSSSLDTRGFTTEVLNKIKEDINKHGQVLATAEDFKKLLGGNKAKKANEYIYGLKNLIHVGNAINRSKIKKDNLKEKVIKETGMKLEDFPSEIVTWNIRTKTAQDGTKVAMLEGADNLNYNHKSPASYQKCPCNEFETDSSHYYSPSDPKRGSSE